MVLRGKALSLKANEVTPSVIKGWVSYCNEQGNSTATISMYQRALRALLRHLRQDGIVKQIPSFTIKAGTRRKDDYLTVPDIIKIQNYEGPNKAEADFWLILYFMNGCNLKDAALLRYDSDFQHNNELSFIRSKTAHKSPCRVYIPIIPPLKALLDRYATPFSDGGMVFPQILLGAKTEKQIDSRIHDFNQWIRVGMQSVCEALGIRTISASAARNSYITCLTWHGISDAFIDAMTGHVGNNELLRGYQGIISPKKRYEVNMHLLRDPEKTETEEKSREQILQEIHQLQEQLLKCEPAELTTVSKKLF